ncbi:hypothetical protein CLOM_g14671 [Closterium sp. NIES-68]|nr:hypothetical protein CLOM_g14671 [Closterium sp. NIES-68]GJP81710.1 hypothetical protein CLOP_g11847 [Closterium sp. NIES-67]
MDPNRQLRLATVLLFVACVLPTQAIKVTVGGFLPNHLSPWSPLMKFIWAEPPPVFPDFLLIFRWVSPVPHSVYHMESKAKFDKCDFSGAKLLWPNSPVGWLPYVTPKAWENTTQYFSSKIPGNFDCKMGLKTALNVYRWEDAEAVIQARIRDRNQDVQRVLRQLKKELSRRRAKPSPGSST